MTTLRFRRALSEHRRLVKERARSERLGHDVERLRDLIRQHAAVCRLNRGEVPR
jgi:hypothetical protein